MDSSCRYELLSGVIDDFCVNFLSLDGTGRGGLGCKFFFCKFSKIFPVCLFKIHKCSIRGVAFFYMGLNVDENGQVVRVEGVHGLPGGVGEDVGAS